MSFDTAKTVVYSSRSHVDFPGFTYVRGYLITQPGGYSGIPPPVLERNDKELLKHPHNLGQDKKMAHVWFTLGFILYFHLLFINGSVSGP